MIQSTLTTSDVFGHSREEVQPLLRQSRLYNPCTRRLLEQAGITTGMKVLDVGSGSGDVTFLAGELVGPRGMVVGVEHDLFRTDNLRSQHSPRCCLTHGAEATQARWATSAQTGSGSLEKDSPIEIIAMKKE